MNGLDVTYEQACMASTKEKYYTKILENIVDYNDRNNTPFSNEKLRKAVSKIVAETEEEEHDAKRYANNVTIYTLCHKSIDITNTQGKISNVTNERLISYDILVEAIK